MKFEEYYKYLQNIDCDSTSFEEIVEYSKNSGIGLPITTSIVQKGAIIERGRKINSINQVKYPLDISYNKPERISDFGRANIPNESMFYGSIPSEQLQHARLAIFFELIEDFENVSKTNKEFSICIGKWRVKEAFEVADVCFSNNYNSNKTLKTRRESWEKKMEETVFSEERNKILLKFFSDEFSKKNIKNTNEYKKTCLFSHMALKSKNFGLVGVQYPSVKVDYQLKNIAIIPEVVDDKLELINVCIFKWGVYKNIYCIYPEYISTNINEFDWKPYKE